MPEVCEVCLTAQYLSSTIGDKITKIKVMSGRYTKHPIKGLDLLEFPLKIKSIDTKGKFMWFTLKHKKNIYYMLTTFGLTGKWSFDELDASHIKFTVESATSTYHMYFCDVRNFGTIEFTDNQKILQKKLDKLAIDLLQISLSDKEFQEKINSLKNKKQKIVVTLMSQDVKTGIGSGLGNYLVPEILYRAKISPHRTIKSLSTKDMIALNNAIKLELRLCYLSNTTEYISHLEKFLKTHYADIIDKKFPNYHSETKIGKELFYFNVYRRKFDNYNNPVIGEKIIPGRTTYWVPDVQV